MGDNPKKKKLDAKLIALTQKHEVSYCRKIAKEILLFNKTDLVGSSFITKARRVAKAFLKATK